HPRVSPQRLYYVKEAHGIVVTDVAFVPESQQGRELLAGNEAALLSVAVDSRCHLHLLPSRRSVPVWALLLLCAGLIVAAILLLQLLFPGFL
ncbi:PREB protein, partial [Crypturellus undulatus]|nr:PREB protein [Crypturellus undulatus]